MLALPSACHSGLGGLFRHPLRTRRSFVLRAGPLLLLALAFMLSPASASTQRRFALLAGNDLGGPDTRPLVFASQDARRVHGVLTQLGGVASGDAELLINRSSGDFLRALANIEARIVEAQRRGERAVLILYYSGHAKDAWPE
jgi:hypothetical protein